MADSLTTGASSTTSNSDPFLSALQDRLMGQASMISSDNSNIENTINSAIGNVQKAGAATDSGINANYQQQEQTAATQGAQKLTSVQEASRGYAVNSGLVQNIQDTTTKQIQNLELQKQQALATGDAATANNIANLQLQGLQFQQQATQQAFTNMLNVGSFMISSKQANLAQEQQTFSEKQAISQVALEYGLQVQPGDTIDSITQRAAPFASSEQKLKLDQLQASINASNAQAQEALSNAAANKDLSASDIDALAQAYSTTPAVMSLIKNPTVAAKVIQKSADYEYSQYKDNATLSKQNGVSKETAQNAINSDSTISSTEKLARLKAIDEVYGDSSTTSTSNGNIFSDINSAISGLVNRRVIGYDSSGKQVWGQPGQKITGYDSAGNPIIK